MKPQDCFGVVIRSLGVLTLVGCTLYVYSTIIALLTPPTPDRSPPYHYLIAAIVLLIFGLYLLRGAPHLMRFAYPKDKEASDEKTMN
jgi:hypothetical protein